MAEVIDDEGMADIETVIEQLVLADTERASDELLGATIAALYDTPELQMLTDKLKEYVSRKDKDIERICEASYQDFVVSVDRVLRIRHDATVLKQQIVSMNDSLQDVGRELLGRVRASAAANPSRVGTHPPRRRRRIFSACGSRSRTWPRRRLISMRSSPSSITSRV